MNFDKIDLEALQRDLEEFAREQQQRGWFRRNWRWFVPTVLLAVIVVGGAALYWALFLRVYGLEVCQSAMRTIEADKGMQAALGQPIQTVKWPSRSAAPAPGSRRAKPTSSGASRGPRAVARAHVEGPADAGKMGDDQSGRWLPNGKKVLLNEAGDNEAPRVYDVRRRSRTSPKPTLPRRRSISPRRPTKGRGNSSHVGNALCSDGCGPERLQSPSGASPQHRRRSRVPTSGERWPPA